MQLCGRPNSATDFALMKTSKPKGKGKNGPGKAKQGKGPRWHLAADTQWGSVSVGSADKPTKLSSARTRYTDNINGSVVRNSRTVSAAPRIEQQEEVVMQLVQSSVGFESTELRFQPGREASFPWLFEIAKKYQKWVAIQAEYEFRSNTSVTAAAGGQGRVVLAFNYDSLDPNLTNLRQAETLQPHAAGKPVDTIVLTLDPRLLSGGSDGRYVRPGQVPAGGDIKTYDGGILYVCTQGFALDGAPIGEVYVRYSIKMLQPIITGMTANPNQSPSLYARSLMNGVALGALGPPNLYIGDVLWQGGSGQATVWNGVEAIIAGTTFTLPAGRYSMRACATIATLSGVTPVQQLTGGAITFLKNNSVFEDGQAGHSGLYGSPATSLTCSTMSMTATCTVLVEPGDAFSVRITGQSSIAAPVFLDWAGLTIETI